MRKNKKNISVIIVGLLLIAQNISSWVFYGFPTAEAANTTPIEEDKLVAIFVAQDIYDAIKNDIARYATQSIQARFPRTKALVFPVDTATIKSTDIQKILSNLYFGGEKDTPSQLISTVLIGDVPLPIVKEDNTIIPTILPYTDLDKPAYVYDFTSGYYIPSDSYLDNKQELSHGLIKFDTIEQYTAYFAKLKKYLKDPSSFAEKKFWFDDFEELQKTYTAENQPLYARSQIFGEDILYHRFSPALFDIINTYTTNSSFDIFTATETYEQENLQERQDKRAKEAESAKKVIEGSTNSKAIPTLTMWQAIAGQLKIYKDVFSPEYSTTFIEELIKSGRWEESDISSNLSKGQTFDTAADEVLLGLNGALEVAVDKQSSLEKRPLNIPIPVMMQTINKTPLPGQNPKNIREVFYFGKNAWDITGANQTSRYRGSYLNLDNGKDALQSGREDKGKSVGLTYAFGDNQIFASRGYNVLLASKDGDEYEKWRSACDAKKNVSMEEFIKYFWGGHTPLNITTDASGSFALKTDEAKYAYNPSFDKNIGGSLFDIAGSRYTTGANTIGASAISASFLGRFQKVAPGEMTLKPVLLTPESRDNYEWCKEKELKPITEYPFFETVNNPPKEQISPLNPLAPAKDVQIVVVNTGAKSHSSSDDFIAYKTISSVVKHTSPTADEINDMNIVTQARPIDSKRYLSFTSLAGNIVKLPYPNFYDVPVYTKTEFGYTLKKAVNDPTDTARTEDTIEKSIITYLEDVVSGYNAILKKENLGIAGYVSPRVKGFALLGAKDPQASPIGRQYKELPKDFFEKILGEKIIKKLANILYSKNVAWKKRENQPTIGKSIASLTTGIYLEDKIEDILSKNLIYHDDGDDKNDSDFDDFMLGATTGGYEAAYINSNGTDIVTTSADTPPTLVTQADDIISDNRKAGKESDENTSQQQQDELDTACGVGPDGTVPLLKRPKALTCWWQNLKKLAIKDVVKVSFKNAEGPVYTIDQIKEIATGAYANYLEYVLKEVEKDPGEAGIVKNIGFEIPTQKVIRGAYLPFSVFAENTFGDRLDNILFPIEISVDTGRISSLGQTATGVTIFFPTESMALDVSTIDPSINKITLTATLSGDNGKITEKKDIQIVDAALRILVNNEVKTGLSLTLPDVAYTTGQLPIIGLRLTDTNGGGITTVATITSRYGRIQPCEIQEKICIQKHLWTLSGGSVDLKLKPAMKAGYDELVILVPGMPERVVGINIEPASAYKTQVTPDALDNHKIHFTAEDVWGNTLKNETKIDYQIISNDTEINGVGSETTQYNPQSNTAEFISTIRKSDKGGITYVYGSLSDVAPSKQVPGYARIITPRTLRPATSGLNVVYLTLQGTAWGDINSSLIPEIISGSSKLISVNTTLFDTKKVYPVVGLFSTNGEIQDGYQGFTITEGAQKIISMNNKPIGYISGNPPYTLSNIIIQDNNYEAQNSWLGGSSNMKGFSIVHKIIDPDNGVVEPYSFDGIRSYAGGVPVGESEIKTFKANSIIYGDPFLQVAGKGATSTGETSILIAKDDEKITKKVLEFDIDNDKKDDLAIIYDDNTMRFMKNYGGTPPYTQLGNLMSIVDGVEDARVGDANGDGRKDIFVKTQRNTLRVYINYGGYFDVNGTPVCIDVPAGDSSLDGIYQLYIADMNKDGYSDLVTNDTRGKIRIFQGGKTSEGGYYVSTSPNGCDPSWRTRQEGHVINVANFGLVYNENRPVYDDALIHWKGLTIPGGDMSEDDENAMVPASIMDAIPSASDPDNINIKKIIEYGVTDTLRFNGTPYDMMPQYEIGGDLETIAYLPMRNIIDEDLVRVYKTYTLDEQTQKTWVTVHMIPKQSTMATYIENLLGPWNIEVDDDSAIVGFNRGNLSPSSLIDWNPIDGYQFTIDNIVLTAGQETTFSYPLTYVATQNISIHVEDTNNDSWLDITTQPMDVCQTGTVSFISQGGTSYTQQIITRKTFADEVNDAQDNIDEATAYAQEHTIDSEKGTLDIPALDGVLEQWNLSGSIRDNIKAGNLEMEGNVNVDINALLNKGIDSALQKYGTDLKKTEKLIQNTMQGLCKGFTAGLDSSESQGLSLPFNIALLAPGDFNIFGCKLFYDKGLPIFAAPTSAVPFIWPPNPAGAGGWFGGTTSQIRIFVAPTLTQSVGIGICFGPEAVGKNIPKPFNNFGGNCIVIAKKAGSSSKGNKNPYNNEDDKVSEVADSMGQGTQIQCRDPFPKPNHDISPLSLGFTQEDVKFDGARSDTDILKGFSAVGNLSRPDSIEGTTVLGIVDITRTPYAVLASEKSDTKPSTDMLIGGSPVELKIQGGNVKGLIKCVVNKWLDNQIRYIANNLTNMSINVYLPDLSEITKGLGDLDFTQLKQDIFSDFTEKNGQNNTPAGSALKALTTKTDGQQLPLNQADIQGINSLTTNPFNTLSRRFEDVPLVSVSTRNVNVQIPFIYSEDITRYMAELQSLLRDSEEKLEAWKDMADEIGALCKRETNAAKAERCNNQHAYYIDVQTKIGQLQASIRKNIQTMQAYKRFPAELQSWLTVSQKYTNEISNSINSISRDLTYWLNTNATRFSSYVDSIIMLIGAVKSWQIMISFSTSWKTQCGQCTVDNYDYYSCTLGMLCPNLPVLAIPPFKIPNVYIDLSRISLGMDVVLPNIQFVPKSIPLVSLNTPLPDPPTINADFTIGYSPNIPEIPEIPAPPNLPELPSFIPSIELNLPTLPPAPKIPSITPAISSTLKVASKIGKLLCIVKNGIGLVGEKGVKARIEQITQRSWSVDPFDTISTTRIQKPLRGFDLRVDSFLNFELNFEGLYTLLDQLASRINKSSNVVLTQLGSLSSSGSSLTNRINEQFQNYVDGLNINTQGNVSPQGVTGEISKYSEPELVEPSVFRSQLQTEVTALKNSEYGDHYKNDIAYIEQTLYADTKVQPNYESIQNATESLQILFDKTQKELNEYQSATTQDYDKFLDSIKNTLLIDNNTDQNGTINLSLYKPSNEVKTMLKNSEHPMKSYLDLEETIANGFIQSLEKHDATTLNMGEFSHAKILQFFRETKDYVQQAREIILHPETLVETTSNTTTQPLSATTASAYLASTSSTQKNIQYVQKDPTTEKKPSATIIPKAHAATISAIENETKNIWRDDHAVYTNAPTYHEKKNDNIVYTRYYEFDGIKKYGDFATKTDGEGYITVQNLKFYIWNINNAITQFTANGQSNDTVSIQWKNTHQIGYLIELRKAITLNHDYTDLEGDKDNRRFVLVYDATLDTGINRLDIPGLPNKKISELTEQDLYAIIPMKMIGDDLSLDLSLGGEHWSYLRITQLSSKMREDGAFFNVYITSPRSSQETLGVQRRGDSLAPQAIGRIYNKDSGELVAEGTNMQIPKKGNYTLKVIWSDDGEVMENTLQVAGEENINTYKGNEATVDPLTMPKDDNVISFNTTATDNAENIGNQLITVVFTKPTIRIDNVEILSGSQNILSSLNTTYPNGYVRFYNQRDVLPNLLVGYQSNASITDFGTPNDAVNVTGGLFYGADTISLYSANNELIARIDKKAGNIIPTTEWNDRLSVRVDSTQNTPTLLLIDKKSGLTLFSLYLRSKSLFSVTPAEGFTIKNLDNNDSTFAGGQCVSDDKNVCVIYIKQDGNIYIPEGQKGRVGGEYEYNGGARYKMSIDGKPAVEIFFIPEEIE